MQPGAASCFYIQKSYLSENMPKTGRFSIAIWPISPIIRAGSTELIDFRPLLPVPVLQSIESHCIRMILHRKMISTCLTR